MAKAAAGYCSVCKRATRGGYAAHAATKSHRTAAYRTERKKAGGSVERTGSGARRGRAARAAKRSQDVYYQGNTIKVRTHARRKPLDGPRRSVHVKRHYRMKPTTRAGYVPPWKRGDNWW